MNEVQRIFQVMTYDIDFAGVLNNGVYIRWLEDLRNIFAENVLPINEASTRGIVPALARTEIDYLAPVRFPDKLEGRMGLLEHGRARFVLWAEFRSQAAGLVTARARQIGLFVYRDTLRPAPLPAEFRALGPAM
jgi:acyl-CoA thioester hydrolase